MFKKIKQILRALKAKAFKLRFLKRECFYINGPETLPPPLTKEEEETVMSELRQGIEEHTHP